MAQPRDLVDEYRLLVCPIVVADGKRMWPDVAAARRLRLADTTVFPTGAVVHTLTRS